MNLKQSFLLLFSIEIRIILLSHPERSKMLHTEHKIFNNKEALLIKYTTRGESERVLSANE